MKNSPSLPDLVPHSPKVLHISFMYIHMHTPLFLLLTEIVVEYAQIFAGCFLI